MTQTGFNFEQVSEPTAAERVTRQIRNLKPEQRFTVELEPGRTVSGRLIYVTPCRAYVELDGKPQTREFVSSKTDRVVSFTDSGHKRVSWPLELEVEITN